MSSIPSFGGNTAPRGSLRLLKTSRWPLATNARAILEHGLPRPGLEPGVAGWRFRNLPNLWRGMWRVASAKTLGIATHFGVLYLDVLHADGQRTPLGLASMRVVTTTGAGFIVDAFQNLVEVENMKYHGFGTGAVAEATADSALGTELTTQYATDNTRPTGSTTEASALVYRTVGTLSPDATVAITEHGVLSQAATGGGVLLDRSVFSAVNLVSGDSLQATYDLTFTAGS